MTPKQQQVQQFLSEFSHWAADQPNILAVALLGSYARVKPTDASDVDLMIVASDPMEYVQDTGWANYFGIISGKQIEDYGKVTSLRVWYSSGPEVEYGFTDETWCALPLDGGTKKVISDGMQILTERGSILSQLKRPMRDPRNSK